MPRTTIRIATVVGMSDQDTDSGHNDTDPTTSEHAACTEDHAWGLPTIQDMQGGHLDLQAAAFIIACDDALCEILRL